MLAKHDTAHLWVCMGVRCNEALGWHQVDGTYVHTLQLLVESCQAYITARCTVQHTTSNTSAGVRSTDGSTHCWGCQSWQLSLKVLAYKAAALQLQSYMITPTSQQVAHALPVI